MPEGDHQFVNITLAGVRSPRVASKPDETSEPFGEEVRSTYRHGASLLFLTLDHLQAKFFTESRLLQRPVKVELLSLPSSTATPFQTTSSSPAPTASIFIGTGTITKIVMFIY